MLVGGAVGPPGVDGVTVHREEVAGLGDFRRPELAVFFQVLHVQADCDRHRRVGRADRRGDSLEPIQGRRPARRHDTVRVLVAEVPCPEGVVAGQGGRHFPGQQRLGAGDDWVGVPVAQADRGDLATGHHPKAAVAVRSPERPRGNPVHSAHVPGEEGGHDRQTRPAGEIRHRDEPVEHVAVHFVRDGLETLPGQEQPDRIETARGDTREVGEDLLFVEVCPPPHRRARRPVVDADPETPAAIRPRDQRAALSLAARLRWMSTTWR